MNSFRAINRIHYIYIHTHTYIYTARYKDIHIYIYMLQDTDICLLVGLILSLKFSRIHVKKKAKYILHIHQNIYYTEIKTYFEANMLK